MATLNPGSTPNASASPAASAGAGAGLGRHWQSLGARERRLVLLGACVLGAYLLWALALAPALKTLRSSHEERARLTAQTQRMQSLASEVAQLRAAPPIPPEQARAVIEGAVARLGPAATWMGQGSERGTVNLKGATAPQLTALLAELRAGARARVVEAQLTASGPGTFDGSLILALPQAAPGAAR